MADDKLHMNIVVAGHVDHGKSTVIGRLLADTHTLPDGKIEGIRELCRRTGKPFEYAFLLDALKDERAQGITIDTARCFFETEKRKYIIIDAPGHIEFLKNMITGASRADAALLVIDAAEGICENSRRHGYMLEMLGITQIAVLVNKIDLVGYDRAVYDGIVRDYTAFLSTIGITPAAFIPVSAMEGDNIASHSEKTPWYDGADVLEMLDRFEGGGHEDSLPLRIPVEDVYKFTEGGDDRRIVAGYCESGTLRAGDEVVFYPSGKSARVKTLEEWFMDADSSRKPIEFSRGKSCGFTLETQIYVRRGEIACKAGEEPPAVGRTFRASMFWLGKSPLVTGKEYLIKSCTAKTVCRIAKIHSVLDAASLEKTTDAGQANRHDIADCTIVCEREIAFDIGASLPATGRFVIVDNYEISGGGIITEVLPDEGGTKGSSAAVSPEERAKYLAQKPLTVSVPDEETGRALERALFEEGRIAYFAPRLSDEQKDALLAAGLIVLSAGDGEIEATGSLADDVTAVLLASDHALEV
ncbi:MAG: 50S ribosome-binding GTPase [Clostridiales bacterium]|nr:50S ribosome-binding GTPase [Clostridiales bacterium]